MFPTNTYLYPNHHVEVSLTVLLDDVPDVVRLPRLLELPPRDEVLYFAYGPNGVLVCLGEPAKDVASENFRELPRSGSLRGANTGILH